VAVAVTGYAQRASQRELGEIVVVKAGYELIVGTGEILLGLDHLYTVGDTGSEAILRPSKTLIGKLDILLGNFNLFFRGIKIEKGRADVLVDLSADIFRFRLSLP